MTTQPQPAQAGNAVKDKRIALRQFMGNQKVELLKLLPEGKVERLIRIALTECVRNADLIQCTAESWALALNACAAWGLYPDSSLGYVYLIPRRNNKKPGKPMEVQAMRGYQGDILLARNSGEIETIYCEVVYTKDRYKVTKGLNRNIEHEPYDGDDDPGPLKAVYAVARLKSGEVAWVDLTKRDVMRHKSASESTGSDYSPWNKHEAAMWKKSAIRELVKWLPRSSEKMEEAIARIQAEADAERREAEGKASVIDITSSTTIPVEDQGDALDRLAAQLGAEPEPDAPEPIGGGTAPPTKLAADTPAEGCPHPQLKQAVLDNMAEGEMMICEDCGEEIKGPGRITAEKAAKAAAKKSGQARLGDVS